MGLGKWSSEGEEGGDDGICERKREREGVAYKLRNLVEEVGGDERSLLHFKGGIRDHVGGAQKTAGPPVD